MRDDGFTFVELMASITIIIIIIAIAVPLYREVTDTARHAADGSNVRTLNQATQMWKIDTGKTIDGFLSNGDERQLMEAIVDSPFLDQQPEDPWGENREYVDTMQDGKWETLGSP